MREYRHLHTLEFPLTPVIPRNQSLPTLHINLACLAKAALANDK